MTSNQEPLAIVRIEEGDVPLLQQFYQTCFQDKPKLNNQDLWRWEFLDNPFCPEGAPFFVIRSASAINGAIGGIRTRMQVGLDTYPSCHPVDFFVAPDYKGLPALRLFRKILEDVPVFYASYVSADAAKLLGKAGFLNLDDDLRMYHYILRPKSAGVSLLRSVRALGVYSARRLLRIGFWLWATLRGLDRYRYRVVDQLSESLVPPFDAGRFPERIGLVKDYAYMAWRFGKSPVLKCRYFAQRKHDIPSCLIVVHEEPGDGYAVIMDIVRGSEDIVDVGSTLVEVIDYYASRGYHMITAVGLNRPLDRLFKKLAFGSQPSNYRFMFYAKDKRLTNQLNDPDRWDFLLGDTDVY
jgi:hypothetical protein